MENCVIYTKKQFSSIEYPDRDIEENNDLFGYIGENG